MKTPRQYTASDLARMGLPGFPKTKRKFNTYLQKNRVPWKRRRERGGGRQYAFTDLPKPLQDAILRLDPMSVLTDAFNGDAERARKCLDNPPFEYDREGLWARFAGMPDRRKEKAKHRHAAVLEVKALCEETGIKKGEAVEAVSSERGISASTLCRWLSMIADYEPQDWLAALVSAHPGRTVLAKFPAEAYEYFKADFLRLERPAASACYDRLSRIAAKNGWRLPSLKTILRRIRRDFMPSTIILAREGEKTWERRSQKPLARNRSALHALSWVVADGHIFDVFVRWPDGEISRPVGLFWQDVYSGKLLSFRIGKTESSDLIRLSFANLVEKFGIPTDAQFDNGRGFAAKMLTGGVQTRYRFKILEEDPTGIFLALGCRIHFAIPRTPQAKTIERSFRDLAESVSKHPRFAGAYVGNRPDAKPENYGSRAVDLAVFLETLNEEVIRHNARKGRRSALCGGKLSFDEVFNDSYAHCVIRKATAEQRRTLLLAAEGVRASKKDGSIHLAKNRYFDEVLLPLAGKALIARFDPEKLHECVYVYRLDGSFVCKADCVQATGFADTEAAREHLRLKRQNRKREKEILKNEVRIDALQAAAMLPVSGKSPLQKPSVVKALFTKGLEIMKAEEEKPRVMTAEEKRRAWQKYEILQRIKEGEAVFRDTHFP